MGNIQLFDASQLTGAKMPGFNDRTINLVKQTLFRVRPGTRQRARVSRGEMVHGWYLSQGDAGVDQRVTRLALGGTCARNSPRNVA